MKVLKSAVINGLLIVLPAWLAILLLLQLLLKLEVVIKPITGLLPDGVIHPTLAALVAFLLISLIVGLLIRTPLGRLLGKWIENGFLRHIPGYSALRGIAAQVGNFESESSFQPAFIEIEDGCLAPAFLIEDHGNGRCTVFTPSVPTPMAGGIFVIARERVHPVNVPVPAMMKCITKWGTGTRHLVATLSPDIPPKIS